MGEDQDDPAQEQIEFAQDLEIMIEELIGPKGDPSAALASLSNAMAQVMSDHMAAEDIAHVIHHIGTTLTALVIERERDKTQMEMDYAETSEFIADRATAAAKRKPN